MKKKIVNLIIGIVFVALALILIYQLFSKLTGHSSTDVQILYVAMSAIISYLLAMSYRLGNFVGEMREFKETTKNSFMRLKEDTTEIKKKLSG